MNATSLSPVHIGRTEDDSTCYVITHAGIRVVIDAYDNGGVVLLVEKDDKTHIYEITPKKS